MRKAMCRMCHERQARRKETHRLSPVAQTRKNTGPQNPRDKWKSFQGPIMHAANRKMLSAPWKQGVLRCTDSPETPSQQQPPTLRQKQGWRGGEPVKGTCCTLRATHNHLHTGSRGTNASILCRYLQSRTREYTCVHKHTILKQKKINVQKTKQNKL